jgi:PAS domain S-box-containing protein
MSLLESDGDEAPASLDLYRAVFESSPQPLLLMAADPPRFTMLAANEAHARTFWTTRQALEGRGVLEVFPRNPERSVAQFMEAIRVSLERVVSTKGPDQMPVGRLTLASASGEPVERYWTATNTPILGAGGDITHIVSASRDVTGEVLERRSEQARKLLMREVDHRARNALTVVQSLVRLSTATSLDELRWVLDGRITSLALAQTSLAARKWEGALLREIIGETVAAISSTKQVAMEGPEVVLPPPAVQALSMIIHELATNALKYGALSGPDGALAVSWERRSDRSVAVVWRETAPGRIEPPTSVGFGTRLIARLVEQLKGAIRCDWPPAGLVAELSFPIEAPRGGES